MFSIVPGKFCAAYQLDPRMDLEKGRDKSMKKQTVQILKIKNGEIFPTEDEVAVERHLSVKINGGENVFPELYTGVSGRTDPWAPVHRGYDTDKKQIKNIQILRDQGEIHVSLSSKITSFSRAGWVFASSEQKERRDNAVPENEESDEMKRGREMSEMSRLFRMADEIFEDPGELFRDTGCAHCLLFVSSWTDCLPV